MAFTETPKEELIKPKLSQIPNEVPSDAAKSAADAPSTEASSTQNEDGKLPRFQFWFVPYCSKTIQEFDSEFKSRQVEWKQSEPYKHCKAKLEEMKVRGIRITNIVALGVGSFHQACM